MEIIGDQKMDKKFNIIMTALIIIMIMPTMIGLYSILEIRKHSVHPVYGEYDQKALCCSPWDACTHDDKCVKTEVKKEK